MSLQKSRECLLFLSAFWAQHTKRTPYMNTRRSQQSTTWKRDFTRTWLCWQPDLGLPTSRIGRNKLLLFISHPVYVIFVIAAQAKTFIIDELTEAHGGYFQKYTILKSFIRNFEVRNIGRIKKYKIGFRKLPRDMCIIHTTTSTTKKGTWE